MQPILRLPEFKNKWSYDLFSNIVTNKSKKFNPQIEDPTKDIELDSIEQNTGRILNTYMSNQFTSQKNKFVKATQTRIFTEDVCVILIIAYYVN